MTTETMFKTDPANILRSVDIVFQVFAKSTYRYKGLFPAVAERLNGQLLMDFPLPPIIPGQRNSDRSPRGCNLQHDIALLEVLDGLAVSLNRPRYTLLREQYLRTFATTCCSASPTGLLPWGEHSYWDLHLGQIGNSYLLQYAERPLDAGIATHHQLHPLPESQWREIHAANPKVIGRFVDGLDWHWMDEERTHFNRHAPMTQLIRGYQLKRHEHLTGIPASGKDGSDFPGASGCFINDYAMGLAIADQPDPAWKAALLRFSDSWWDRRLDTGVCPKSGSSDAKSWNGPDLSQTLSLVDSTLPAADALRDRDPELATLLRDRATAYMRGILSYPQDLADEGRLVMTYNQDGSPFKSSQPWAGNRGSAVTAKLALELLVNAQRIDDPRGLEIAARAARVYLTSRLPRDVIVRAADPAAVIALLGELYRLTGEAEWLDGAMLHATDVMELYFDSPLPRAATGRGHYESQLGSSYLVHALGRLSVLGEGGECLGGIAEPMA